MSHFTVAVFSDGTKTVEQLLAPYQENNMGNCPKAYLQFYDIEDEYRAEYEEKKKNKGAEFEEEYPSWTEYIENYCEIDKDPETGHYGYWENPNAKWDWWQIGGRFAGCKGRTEGKVKEYDFTPDEKIYKESCRFWEIAIEGQPLLKGEEKPYILYKTEYYKDRYHDKENYARIQSNFNTWAVITPDGAWYQQGQMGWWLFSDETHEEAEDWYKNYKARFIDTADPEWELTIVDCHI